MVHYKTHTWVIINIYFFDVWRLCLLTTIGATHVEESVTFLEGGEVHNSNCENNCVLDFIVEPLEDPNP
jgi:hypothetical protein